MSSSANPPNDPAYQNATNVHPINPDSTVDEGGGGDGGGGLEAKVAVLEHKYGKLELELTTLSGKIDSLPKKQWAHVAALLAGLAGFYYFMNESFSNRIDRNTDSISSMNEKLQEVSKSQIALEKDVSYLRSNVEDIKDSQEKTGETMNRIDTHLMVLGERLSNQGN